MKKIMARIEELASKGENMGIQERKELIALMKKQRTALDNIISMAEAGVDQDKMKEHRVALNNVISKTESAVAQTQKATKIEVDTPIGSLKVETDESVWDTVFAVGALLIGVGVAAYGAKKAYDAWSDGGDIEIIEGLSNSFRHSSGATWSE